MEVLGKKVLAAITLLIFGFVIGWHCKGVSVTAADVVATKAQTKAVVADYVEQGAKQHAQQTAEQGKSLALGADQLAIHSAVADVKQEIRHVTFHPVAAAPADRGACPDPVGSAEFVRLYNAAARGHPAAAGSAAAR